MYEKEDGTLVPLKELKEEIDLHRPFVDRVIFKKDGKLYRRTPEIIDVWFDSGSMPFAQFHYPFENKELFEKSFPADFIAEGIDQTRGWFYTLHNIATVLFNKPAFKNIIVNELILDKDGQKMSKSRGNVVYPLEMMDKYGADALRWYFMAVSPPWIPKRFDENGLLEIVRKFFTTLYNVYSFFVLYANIDDFDPHQDQIPFEDRPEIDRWILSRLYSVSEQADRYLENYDITKAARTLSDYLIDDVSNWYVRRNRRRFWKSEAGSDKTAAYQTLHEVLLTFAKLIAPLAPFISEEIFLNLKRRDDAESVHLEMFPKLDEEKKARQDAQLEQKMALAQKVVSTVRALRNDRQIKVRQPLARVLLYSADSSIKKAAQEMAGIICEEINVKRIELVDDENDLVNKSAKPNFKVLGTKVGKMMGQLSGVIKTFGAEQIAELENKGKTHVHVDGHEVHLEAEDVEIVAEPKPDLAVQSDAGMIVALDLIITDELREEGLAREFVNRIQNLRKEAGFEVMDHIIIQIENLADDLLKAVQNQERYICNETLADKIIYGNITASFHQEVSIENKTFKIGLEKSK